MIVEARGVVKRFGARVAVDGIDLDVPAGICFGLLGPNGAGKTTTLRMIYGVSRPTAGTIHVFGIDIASDPRAVRRRLGVTLQESVLIDALTPVDNLRVFGRYHLLREPDLSRRIDELIEFLELRSHADVPVQRLSGGFKRRLAIAMSLMNQPELLVLDEPTTGLDPAVRLALWARVRDLRAAGTTVLLTTHYMDEAQRLCDRVAIVANGKIISEGAPAAMIAASLTPEVVEIDCDPSEETALLDGTPVPRAQLRTGRRVMLYVDDAAPLVDRIHQSDPSNLRSLVVRPTNLEDVYLRLTGTSLEGGA
jgi:lipooligosaccharide transport system ATP-binding protein